MSVEGTLKENVEMEVEMEVEMDWNMQSYICSSNRLQVD